MFFEQRHALGHDGFTAADWANLFAGLGFNADAIGRNVEQLGQTLADGGFVGGKLRLLGKHDAVDVHDLESGRDDFNERPAQHVARVAAPIDRRGVREQLADVAQRSGAKQRVGYGMQQHIGIAMPHGMVVVGDIDPA